MWRAEGVDWAKVGVACGMTNDQALMTKGSAERGRMRGRGVREEGREFKPRNTLKTRKGKNGFRDRMEVKFRAPEDNEICEIGEIAGVFGAIW